ncbi:MAG: ATP-dependent DNA helicase RecQ [Candidatus Sericytochromatia bacterium]|nr:ATP-dependent DNA helicase RecQ [Candidatus Tanganyikabacteria bacterium]
MLALTQPDLAGALRLHFGHAEFREGQTDVIDSLLAGRDTVAVMPTGRGKSLCYQLPALLLPGATVVVSPLVALMKDQTDALAARGIAATFINSSLDPAEQHERISAMEEGAWRLVYVAPERFRQPAFVAAVARARISLFAVDEAHCISDWGHQIRPDYLRLPEAIAACGRPPVLACTATATPEVREDLSLQLGLSDPSVVVSGFDRPNLRYVVRFAPGREAKRAWLMRILGAVPGSQIVYAATRRGVEEVAEFLGRSGVPCAAYHAGLPDEARSAAQDRFMTGAVRVIVATNAFGMGIDKADVRGVVHYDLPGSLEAYYQEAGRAGRDGRTAFCTLLYSAADRKLREFLIDRSDLAGGEAAELDPALVARRRRLDHARLARMVSYAYAERCRRNVILQYFGERKAGACGRCDVCTGQVGSAVQAPPPVPAAPRVAASNPRERRERAVASTLAADPALFEALRARRAEIAKEEAVPAFVVFHDATLLEMAAHKPRTAREFAALKGVGARKLERYGAFFLAVVNRHLGR